MNPQRTPLNIVILLISSFFRHHLLYTIFHLSLPTLIYILFFYLLLNHIFLLSLPTLISFLSLSHTISYVSPPLTNHISPSITIPYVSQSLTISYLSPVLSYFVLPIVYRGLAMPETNFLFCIHARDNVLEFDTSYQITA